MKNRASKVEIRSIDELAVYSDEELNNRLNYLISELAKRESPAHEVEVCYVQREQEIRKIRREQHEKYVTKIRYEEVDNELYLPEYVPTQPPSYWLVRNT